MLWIGFVGLSGFLMVSTWRFWSGKEINFARSHPFQILFVLSIVVFVTVQYSHFVFFAIGLTYMFSGIWARAAYSWSRQRRRDSDTLPAEDPAAIAPDPLHHS